MKKFLFFMTLVLTMVLSSCGGGIKPADPAITYSPYSRSLMTVVNVPVKDAFEVISVSAMIVPDDEFPILYSNIKATINVKTLTTPASDGHKLSGDCTVQLLDENNAVIEEESWHVRGESELFNSEAGDVNTLTATFGDKWSEKIAKEMLAKVKYIRLSSVGCGYEVKEEADNASSSYEVTPEEYSDDVAMASDDSSEDWNAVLDSYENYATRYVDLYKKAQQGETSALTEYPALMEQAQLLSEKLTNAQGAMSESQWARYIKITNQMASGIANS